MMETARLRIRVLSDEEMVRFIQTQTDEELIEAYKEMLQGSVEHPEQRVWYAIWSIERKDGTSVGDLCFKGPPENGAVEIGYGILASCYPKPSEDPHSSSSWRKETPQ